MSFNIFAESENEEICDLTYVEMNRNRYIVAVGWDRRINIYTDDMSDSNIHHIQHPIDKWADDVVSIVSFTGNRQLTLLHSQRLKLHSVLAFLSAIGLKLENEL